MHSAYLTNKNLLNFLPTFVYEITIFGIQND
jgi:hypothetical protein